jgi:hypothetical protein
MGCVYRCRDVELDREVAVKVIPCLGDPEAEIRIQREALAMARVKHRHLLALLDVFHEGTRSCLVLDYVRGDSLDQLLLREGVFSAKRVRILGLQVGQALATLHQSKILHRDVKPGNIMLDAGGEAILMDLGLVRLTDRASFTDTKMLVGTPLYMPPEVVLGKGWVEASDQYQLGTVLFRCLTGKDLISETSVVKVLDAISSGRRRSLEEAPQAVPTWLWEVVERACSVDPQNRFRDVKSLVWALKKRTGGMRRPLLATETLELGSLSSPDEVDAGKAVGFKAGFLAGSRVGYILGGSVFSLMLVWVLWAGRGVPAVPTAGPFAKPLDLFLGVREATLETALEAFTADPTEAYREWALGGDSVSREGGRSQWRLFLDRVPGLLTGKLPLRERRRIWQRWQRAQLSVQQERLLGEHPRSLNVLPKQAGWRGRGLSPFGTGVVLKVLHREGGEPKTWPPEGANLKLPDGLRIKALDWSEPGTRVDYLWPKGLAEEAQVIAITVLLQRIAWEHQLQLEWRVAPLRGSSVFLWAPDPLPEGVVTGLFRKDLTVLIPRGLLPKAETTLSISMSTLVLPSYSTAEFYQVRVSWPGGPGAETSG